MVPIIRSFRVIGIYFLKGEKQWESLHRCHRMLLRTSS